MGVFTVGDLWGPLEDKGNLSSSLGRPHLSQWNKDGVGWGWQGLGREDRALSGRANVAQPQGHSSQST